MHLVTMIPVLNPEGCLAVSMSFYYLNDLLFDISLKINIYLINLHAHFLTPYLYSYFSNLQTMWHIQ